MAVEEPAVVEKLRALAQYQLAVYLPCVPGSFAKKTLNTFLKRCKPRLVGGIFSKLVRIQQKMIFAQ